MALLPLTLNVLFVSFIILKFVFFLVASDETMPGFTAVGKNVMVLKEHQVIALKYLARIL